MTLLLPAGHRFDPAALREAIVLPLLFLTVTLAGGFRMGAGGSGMRFLAPPLITLVLSVLTLGALVRGGLLVGERLMSARRTPLENLSGATILVTLFTATAQVFNSVTPEAGLLHVMFNTFFLLLLWNTLAAGPEGRQLLHSLLVVFGSAFGLKYIVLAALYDPQGGVAKRVLTTLLEGMTLGALDYRTDAPATGYVAFFTIVLYVMGLALLPHSGGDRRPDGSRPLTGPVAPPAPRSVSATSRDRDTTERGDPP